MGGGGQRSEANHGTNVWSKISRQQLGNEHPSRAAGRLPRLANLGVEDFVLHDVEVHCEEAGLQGGAESVALHQADLGIGGLVAEQVLLGGNHVLQDLEKDVLVF